VIVEWIHYIVVKQFRFQNNGFPSTLKRKTGVTLGLAVAEIKLRFQISPARSLDEANILSEEDKQTNLRPWQTRTHCCGHIVAHDVARARKRAGHKINVVCPCCVPETKLCPQQMLRARANGETFVLATMCLQQFVLVCQGLKVAGNSFQYFSRLRV